MDDALLWCDMRIWPGYDIKKGGQLVIIMRVKRTFFANFYQSKI